MEVTKQSAEFEDPIRSIGPDSTATFDNTASNPTEHASSEALDAATAVDDEDDEDLSGDGIAGDGPLITDAPETGADDADEDDEEEYDDDDEEDEDEDDDGDDADEDVDDDEDDEDDEEPLKV